MPLVDRLGCAAVEESAFGLRLARHDLQVCFSVDSDERNGHGEFSGVHASQPAVASSYRQVLAAAVGLLGVPALVGGPDAYAKWRRPDTTVTVSRRLHREQASIAVAVAPTVPTETADYRYAEWDPDWTPRSRWEVRPQPGSPADHALVGNMRYPHRNVTSWPELSDCLHTLFGSLAADICDLRPYASAIVWVLSTAGGDLAAQGWFADDECHLEMPGAEPLTLPPGLGSGLRLADLTMQALRRSTASSPKDLRYEAWAPRPQRASVDGFGVPHVRYTNPVCADEE